MVPRLTSLFPLIFITLSIFADVELSGLAMGRFLFAAEPPGDRKQAGVASPALINERNLLGLPPAGRSEEAAVADPFADLQATSLDLVLMGIVDGGHRDSRAVILSKKDARQQIYQVGDVVAGARIKSILWGKVVLSIGGREEVLDMKETARYRVGEIAAAAPGAAPVAAPDVSQDRIVASSERSGEVDSRLIPERVRLAPPDQDSEGPLSGE